MPLRRVLVVLFLSAFSAAAFAATEAAVVTLADGATRVLRGATWYKLAPGIVVEDGDIVAAEARAQVQLETRGGTLASLAGDGLVLVAVSKDGALALTAPVGWLKLATKPPGAVVRTAQFEVNVGDGIVVMRVVPDAAEIFIEAGGARITEPGIAPREARRGEFLRKFTGTPAVSSALAPKAFVDALPRMFIDPLPVLAPRLKSKPALVVDHEVTYAEAEPWLAGPDRVAFEKRFAVRLKDPAFRKAAEPGLVRHPAWDRMLHPEKYAPKPPPPAVK